MWMRSSPVVDEILRNGGWDIAQNVDEILPSDGWDLASVGLDLAQKVDEILLNVDEI